MKFPHVENDRVIEIECTGYDEKKIKWLLKRRGKF